MSTVDLEAMLEKVTTSQWALGDIDWKAPGAETITDEQRPRLRRFMADLVWIEQVGSRAFAALAKQAPDPTLATLYRYFHAEEQRHANAELALMQRWGMLENGEVPAPNINLQMAVHWLDGYADELPLAALGSIIPLLEIALDGALLKFLLEEVHDPVCHQVFRKINADEARHLAVDFRVLELISGEAGIRRSIEALARTLRPAILLGLGLVYVPVLSRARDAVIGMGLEDDRLKTAMMGYVRIGGRNPRIRRNPYFWAISRHAQMVVDRDHPYQRFAELMVRLTAHIPRRWLGPNPAWTEQLTHRPTT